MKTDIGTTLKKGKLTPKERVVLIVSNAVKEEREGTGFLSTAEKHDLSMGWEAKTNEEIREYNRYIEAWRTVGYAEFDAQTTHLQGQVSFYQALWLLESDENDKANAEKYKMRYDTSALTDATGSKYKEEALNLFLNSSGYEYEEMIFDYARSEFIDDKTRQDIKRLVLESNFEDLHKITKIEEIPDFKPTAKDKALFSKISEARNKAKKIIDGLIKDGQLEVVDKIDRHGGWYVMKQDSQEWTKVEVLKAESIKLIKGKGIYNLDKSKYSFVGNYTENLEKYLPLAEFITRVKTEGVASKYALLLGFLEVFKRLSKTFQTDLTYKLEKWLKTTRDAILTLNIFIRTAQNEITNNLDSDYYNYKKGSYRFRFIDSEISIDIDAIQPDTNLLKPYIEDLEKKLDKDF